MKIENNELRPCLAHGEKALFHRWSHVSQIRQAVLRGQVSGIISDTFAIVEYEDGTVSRVEPEHIIFLGNEFSKYCFYECEGKKEDGAVV